jgi:hypothetical protein
MTVNDILTQYLVQNGAANPMGTEDLLAQADKELNETDPALMQALERKGGERDLYALIILALLVVTFLVIIYKMIVDIRNDYTVFFCLGLVIIVVGAMHRVWRDKMKIHFLLRAFPLLDKKDRLKIANAYTKDTDKVFDFGPRAIGALFKGFQAKGGQG